MAVQVLTGGSVNLPVGGVWEMTLAVTGEGGSPGDETPVVTVTLPEGGSVTPTPELIVGGVYRVLYVTAAEGRHVARAVTATLGAADLTAWATAAVPASGMPTLDDLRGDPEGDPPTYGYLGRTSFTDAEISDALAVESSAQRDVCRVPAGYPPSLRGALMRRVAVHLAKRSLPLAMVQGDAEAGGSTAYVPGRDPEVRRLEKPYPRLVVG